MIVMGIDPGSAVTGMGVVEIEGETKRLLGFRAIRTNARKSLPERLGQIYRAVQADIAGYNPDVCAVEQVFGGKNIRSALIIGQARGAAMMAAINAGVEIAEYTPAEVKMSVVGNGAASKEQVQYMVKHILKLAEAPRPFDCADAIAVALCHAHRKKLSGH